MPQSRWDEPTQQVGPIPGPTGVDPSRADPAQPSPGNGQPGSGQPGNGQQRPGQPDFAQPSPGEAAGNGRSGLGRPGPGEPGRSQPDFARPVPDDAVDGDQRGPDERDLGQPGLGEPGGSQPDFARPVPDDAEDNDEQGPGEAGRDERGLGERGPDQPDFSRPEFGQPDLGQPVPGQPGMAEVQFGGAPLQAPGQPLPPAGWRPLPAAPRRSVWRPTRAEVGAGLLVIVLLAVVGAGVALLWWQVAPRLGFKIVAPGDPEAVAVEREQFFATDGWYVVFTLIVGLLATLLAWRVKVLRGPVGLVALGVGSLLGAVITWRGGLLLGPAPTAAQLQEVGRVVYPALRLRATAALMVEPLAAVAAYLLLVGFAARPDLGRPDEDQPAPFPPPYREPY